MSTTVAVGSNPVATMAVPKSAAAKQNAKMHRRSRSGCFTCRLRRKKCDEGKAACRACKHLGLRCEYKRPMWWGNNEQRKQQKEEIKTIIRHTKLSEKTAQMMSMGADTPPRLSHSVPTSDTYSDTLDRTRAASIDSQFSLDFEGPRAATAPDFLAFIPHPHPHPHLHPSPFGLAHAPPPLASPYHVECKTESETLIDDIPTRRHSSLSTFSAVQASPFARPAHASVVAAPDAWPCAEAGDGRRMSMASGEDPAEWGYFHLPLLPAAATAPAVIQVDEGDQHLLDHFVNNVLRLIFPVLEVNRHGRARSEVILPALASNACYLHCCLSIAALHMKTTQEVPGERIDQDIMRHRYATIAELCDALNRDTDHPQILEATLGLIFFQCTVGRPDDALPDIPWHQHFQAVHSLAYKLELPRALTEMTPGGYALPPFHMTLTAWIDILGATMLGRKPLFADTYREKHLNATSAGLRELMGCDDRIMYLISEMACLETHKRNGMDDLPLCEHVHSLARALGHTESSLGAVAPPYAASGALRPAQLTENMTAVFRFAARLYLCSLVPGYDCQQANIVDLVAKLTDALRFVPAGPDGFDRSLVWPYLIGGSAATAGSGFRSVFQRRIEQLGDEARTGSFGRMVRLMREVWRQADELGPRHVHWRDVMQQKGWDDLLI
ncbi:MAG: hypothetical protein M1826_004180 [Phylliscum demangeonii]|nr:MAG: hypothetical protein M1826_004180 [Phylliscum demangeonii]